MCIILILHHAQHHSSTSVLVVILALCDLWVCECRAVQRCTACRETRWSKWLMSNRSQTHCYHRANPNSHPPRFIESCKSHWPRSSHVSQSQLCSIPTMWPAMCFLSFCTRSQQRHEHRAGGREEERGGGQKASACFWLLLSGAQETAELFGYERIYHHYHSTVSSF